MHKHHFFRGKGRNFFDLSCPYIIKVCGGKDLLKYFEVHICVKVLLDVIQGIRNAYWADRGLILSGALTYVFTIHLVSRMVLNKFLRNM